MIELKGGDDYSIEMLNEMYENGGYTFEISAGHVIGIYEPGGGSNGRC